MRRALPPLRALLGAARPPRLPERRGTCGPSAGHSALSVLPSFGFLFDIDGVLVRGRTPIPAARTAFRKLVNPQGQFLVPVVFVTNAGNCLRQEKADQLSHLLGVPISQDQVMMSHSPLRMFKPYHEKCVLVSGQGPLLDIAQDLGFCQPITIDALREKRPLLDAVDHDRRPNVLSPSAVELPKIEAVVLFGEPVRWETSLQLIIDVLLTSGYPGNPYGQESYPHIPVLACNMDLMWVAEAQSPRFGHGTFMVCLENIYKKITGKDLKYEALMGKPSRLTYQYAEHLIRAQALQRSWEQPIQTLYAVGDNVMTDVYGANLFNRYLQESSRPGSRARLQAQAAAGRAPALLSRHHQPGLSWEKELAPAAAARCRSVLVCTGVYDPHCQVALPSRDSITEHVFHGHRDFSFDPALVEPDHIVPDVDAAVDLVFQLENFAPH
ncbi:haloacid dehalogenase-like hydrolase domain-containing 5 isoform X2 [Motacilla alba alba]|uniref:haloacid dehalogenase-like hydrolase domain-containing 5 isoform X2 n=1 Tax=Motacilla alba alba TaxID=1094192 RepID=UPI0018D595C1|nr:haloacid dehalogenase-like hydrolase domain-containing 5 isoform X2 [Motacilla alba alba]